MNVDIKNMLECYKNKPMNILQSDKGDDIPSKEAKKYLKWCLKHGYKYLSAAPDYDIYLKIKGSEQTEQIDNIKQIAESDNLFENEIHKVKEFYLIQTPRSNQLLKERLKVINKRNKNISPCYDEEYYCSTCGAKDGAEHPTTAYCFYCDTDNWTHK